MEEKQIISDILLESGRMGIVLFRNNTGVGWQSNKLKRVGTDTILTDARPLHAGLCKGSPDLVGWKTVLVTQEMVGKNVAVFVGVECKTEQGQIRPEQLRFIDCLEAAGGISGFARSLVDFKKIAG